MPPRLRGAKVELLVKGKTDKRIRGLVAAPGMHFTFQYAEKGSYRQDNLLRYLRRVLEPWTAQRAATGDWRLLFMDVAKSHVADDVAKLANEHGYAVIYHYGCTTGVAQVNDTDLHQELEAHYIEFEQASFHEQQRYDPGNINRSLQQVVDDLCAAWRSCDHRHGLKGHKSVGISNALNTTEDYMITREALDFWIAAEMPRLRAEAIAEVDALVAKGELVGFADWGKLIKHPNDPGVMEDEGAELYDGLAKGEPSYVDDASLLEAADDFDVEHMDHPIVIAAAADDEPAAVEEAVVLAKRLEALKAVKAAVDRNNVPSAGNILEREIRQLSRGLRAGSRKEEQRVNHVLRRAMDAKFREELDAVKERRNHNFARHRRLAVAKAALAKSRRAKESRTRKNKEAKAELAKAAAAKKARLALLPKRISSLDLGTFTPKGLQARTHALERIKLHSPMLSEDRELRWELVRDRFVKEPPLHFKYNAPGWGQTLVKNLEIVLKQLGSRYEGHSQYKADKKGNPNAFQEFFDRMEASLTPLGFEIVC